VVPVERIEQFPKSVDSYLCPEVENLRQSQVHSPFAVAPPGVAGLGTSEYDEPAAHAVRKRAAVHADRRYLDVQWKEIGPVRHEIVSAIGIVRADVDRQIQRVGGAREIRSACDPGGRVR